MVFSSIPFLYYFLPCVLLLYFAAPKRMKNTVLFLSSLFFYAWGEPKYVLLMLVTILQGYIFGILIEKTEGRWSKLCLSASCLISLGLLFYCKYADFFIENMNRFTGTSLPLLQITLPIGISFYTFQIISYLVDVYRADVPAQRNFIKLGTYVTMFPQLIAGPIVRYSHIAGQLDERSHNVGKCALGIRRFVIGLGKKVLLANVLGELISAASQTTEPSVLFCWLYAVGCTLHIYFDFSGYSDMAIGLGNIFGFDFPENFNYPYISRSITEFWRRWHISLGAWFRDYVYIPLGGNRVSKGRWFFNIMAVWLLTGFWHGAAWGFLLWGVYFGILLITEKLWLMKYLEKTKVLRHIYVMLIVIFSFVLFDASGISDAFLTIKSMLGGQGLAAVTTESLYYLKSYTFVLLAAALGATPLLPKMTARLRKTKKGNVVINLLEPIFLMLVLITATGYIVDGSFNPFLYFRF
ncbi:MAG: MBOAT family protein [Lachnospiraceae bacterium]|nr:MBOAT family protein [Lachnospiraceae bacterium]